MPRRRPWLAFAVGAIVVGLTIVAWIVVGSLEQPTPTTAPTSNVPAPGSASPVPDSSSAPATTPAVASNVPAPVDVSTPEPCGTFDPRCSRMPVDGGGAPITPDLACGTIGTCHLAVDIYHPRSGGPWPVLVVVPGGPMPPGERSGMGPFAQLVAGQGAVVFVTDYRAAPTWGGGYPISYQDVACAIRFARANADLWGGDGSRVTLVAHSFGAFIASVVALSADAFEPAPTGCLATSGSTKPDAFIGIAGVYSQDDVSQVTLVDQFGGTKDQAQATWTSGDPYAQVAGRSNISLPIELIHGTLDNNVRPASSVDFKYALDQAGYRSQLTFIENADHSSVLQDHHTIEAVLQMANTVRP